MLHMHARMIAIYVASYYSLIAIVWPDYFSIVFIPSYPMSVISCLDMQQWRIQDGAFGANAPPPPPPTLWRSQPYTSD